MKMSQESVMLRRTKLMQQIQASGEINVEEIALSLDVTPMTIRRDLQYWEEQGAIERFYGGARLVQSIVNPGENNNESYKHAIAKYTTQFINDGDTIFINTSSTALLILKYLENKYVNVITNNAKAIFINHDPKVTVVLTGGELRTPKESMVGDFALNNLNKVTADKCFLGCSGFSLESGMCTAILPEVSINETMIRRCKGNVFILADATKIEKTHQFSVAESSSFQYLITDKRVDQTVLDMYKDNGICTVALDKIPVK